MGGFFDALFGKKEEPVIVEDKTAQAEEARQNAALKEAERLRKRKGASSTIATGMFGDTSNAPVLKKTLGGV